VEVLTAKLKKKLGADMRPETARHGIYTREFYFLTLKNVYKHQNDALITYQTKNRRGALWKPGVCDVSAITDKTKNTLLPNN
jgi:hypothetical protein